MPNIVALILCAAVLTGCTPSASISTEPETSINLSEIPEFQGDPYVPVNNNMPDFSEEDFNENSFEHYSDLDELGRCGVAYANIGKDLMPTEERGSISNVKPSGWGKNNHNYEDLVDGGYIYNRCHLIGYQLTGEDANEKNLITGTRYMNVDGMLPFENMVADYVKEENQHVLYRVTPIYDGDNLVANGVQMEAISVEDKGEGICFNVYVYNNQPGITIDYATGENWLTGQEQKNNSTASENNIKTTYVLNTSSKRFHMPGCSSAAKTKDTNKETYTGYRDDLIQKGYQPCGQCKP